MTQSRICIFGFLFPLVFHCSLDIEVLRRCFLCTFNITHKKALLSIGKVHKLFKLVYQKKSVRSFLDKLLKFNNLVYLHQKFLCKFVMNNFYAEIKRIHKSLLSFYLFFLGTIYNFLNELRDHSKGYHFLANL